MKKNLQARKFKMRIGAVLLMVFIMLMGSCLSDLRFSALATDANEALVEAGQPTPNSGSENEQPTEVPIESSKSEPATGEAETPTPGPGSENKQPTEVPIEESKSESATGEVETPAPGPSSEKEQPTEESNEESQTETCLLYT